MGDSTTSSTSDSASQMNGHDSTSSVTPSSTQATTSNNPSPVSLSKLKPGSQPYIPRYRQAAAAAAASPAGDASSSPSTSTTSSPLPSPSLSTNASTSTPEVSAPEKKEVEEDKKEEVEKKEEEKKEEDKKEEDKKEDKKEEDKKEDDKKEEKPAAAIANEEDDVPKEGEAGSEIAGAEEEDVANNEGDAEETEEALEEGDKDASKDDEDDDDNIRLVPNAPQGKRVYDPAFLLSFQSKCREKPEGLPDNIDDIMNDPTKKRPISSSGGWSERGGDRGRGFNRGRGGRGGRGGDRGGLSRSKGGNQSGPKAPLEALPPPDPKAWAPASRRAGGQDKSAQLSSKVTYILNRVSLKHFESLSTELTNIVNEITDINDFKLVVTLVFDRAIVQQDFSALYAQLCSRLQKSLALSTALEAPATAAAAGGQQMSVEKKNQNLFRRTLLNKCQEEFENKAAVQKQLELLTAEDKTEEELKLRERMLGNVIFIGELFKLNMLTEKIMHGGVIANLLTAEPSHLDLEALCKLFTGIGKLLDNKNKEVMDTYFNQLQKFRDDPSSKYPSRIKFTISDLIDLRDNRWVDTTATGKRPPSKSSSSSSNQESDRDPSPPRGGRAGAAPRRAASATNIPASKQEPKGPDDWEVVSSSKGGRQRDQRSGRGDRDRDAGKQAASSGKGGAGSQRGGRDTRGGRGDSQSGGRGGPAGGRKDGRGGAQTASSGGRGGRGDGPKKKDESVGSGNMFSLLGGDDEPASSRSRKPAQELYVPGQRRAAAKNAAADAGRRAPPPEDLEEDDAHAEPEEMGENAEIKAFIEEYLASGDDEEAATCLKDLADEPNHYLVVVVGVEIVLSKKEADRAKIVSLLSAFSSEGLLDGASIRKGFTQVIKQLPNWAIDMGPSIFKTVGSILGQAIARDLLPLSFLASSSTISPELVTKGKALPLAVYALNAVAISKGEEFKKAYDEAGIELTRFVKEEDRANRDMLLTYLKDDAKVSPFLLAVAEAQ